MLLIGDATKQQKCYMIFLGMSFTKEGLKDIPKKVRERVKPYQNKLLDVDNLPQPFVLRPSAFGDNFLIIKVDGEEYTGMRVFLTKIDGKWYNITHNEFETPEKIISENDCLL